MQVSGLLPPRAGAQPFAHKALGLPSEDLHNRKIHLDAICSSFTGDIHVSYLSHPF